MRLFTTAGRGTTSGMVNPRKPVVDACDAPTRILLPNPNAAV
jgi:hypothetical protein